MLIITDKQWSRSILHMDLDTFFVSVSRLLHPELQEKPVLVGGPSGRGVVASCSYETRRFGVRSGMPMRMALRLCPDARIVHGDYDQYSQYSGIITGILNERAPVFEKSSIDEFYIDLTGMDRFFGSMTWANELRGYIIKETGLPISQCLAVNKLVSKIGANEIKPNGSLQVAEGTEKAFISPLHVGKIPMVGDMMNQRLKHLGIVTIRKLQEIPVRYLQLEFGKYGIELHKKAHAIDESPVEPYSEQKSMSKETTFEIDTTDVTFLRAQLVRLTEDLSFELRRHHKLTGCVSVKIRYSDFNTHIQQRQIAYCAQERMLIDIALDLFDKLYQRRLLVRLIGVKFSKLASGGHQLDLYRDNEQETNLFREIDLIRSRFGMDKVRRAISMRNVS